MTYGQVIQLRHCRTGKFLTATKQASEVDREAMQLSLEVDNASATGFLINARIKIRSEGDPVSLSLHHLTFNLVEFCFFSPLCNFWLLCNLGFNSLFYGIYR